ncbi:MAG TPA: hypothetical protein VFJ23_06160 [Candidatus Nitrosotalea sp.]|nr:hypothetical protein [Candidatus Nitrosotalea sp.]
MVKHPKKKGDENPSVNDDTKDNPTGLPNQTEESRIKGGLDKLFWLRVGLGVLAGSLSALIGSGSAFSDESSRVGLGFGIMIILFIVSYVIAKSLRIPIAAADKKKLITTGYGSYFLMFIFCWILVNTLIHPDVGIATVR